MARHDASTPDDPIDDDRSDPDRRTDGTSPVGVRLDSLLGHRSAEVLETLEGAGIVARPVTESLAGPFAFVDRLLPERRAHAGDHVTAHLVGDKVVRLSIDPRARRADEAQAVHDRLDRLEARVAQLEGAKSAGAPDPGEGAATKDATSPGRRRRGKA